jgi:acyl-CoA thioesterase-1
MIRIAIASLALLLCATAAPPRVLILGDSVYRQPQAIISKELAGKIELVRPEIRTGELFNSTAALAHLDELLGAGKWDLVIFNAGIGDLIHRAPGMKNFRIMPIEQGGVPNTSAKDYEANLNKLAERLKATGAKLVWASTTPLTDATVFVPDSEIGFNAIAAKVMAAHSIPILDMHGHITRLTAGTQPRAPRWETFGSNKFLIHAPILDLIKSQLPLR